MPRSPPTGRLVALSLKPAEVNTEASLQERLDRLASLSDLAHVTKDVKLR
jgi:hypothetical protein